MSDLSVTAATVALSAGGANTSYLAGGTITAGMPVYLDSATNTLKAAKADTTAAIAAAVGIALHASLSGQPLAYAPTGCTINLGATTAKNVTYVVSAAAAGGICAAADLASTNRITNLGYATGTSGAVFVIAIQQTGVAV